MDIWIKNATIATLNENNEVLKNSNLYIKGNRIFHIGHELSDFKAERIIYANNNLIMPGLINGHTHIGMSAFRNYGNDVDLETWLNEYIWPKEKLMKPEDVYYSSKLSLAEMMSTGTTSFVDMYFFSEEVARATKEIGLRAIITRGLTDPSDEQLREQVEFFNKWNNAANGRIKVKLAPHAVYTNSKKSLLKIKALNDKLKCGINIHLNESLKEVQDCINKTGMPPLEYVNSLGLIDNKTIAAHCTWLSDHEIEIVKNKNVTVVHNPISNLKLASGILDTQRLLEAGINVALGTDSSSSNNTLDMFQEMKFASLLAKGTKLNPAVLDALTTLKMATINGAKLFEQEHELGRLKVGYLADIILVNISNINHSPTNSDLISSLVYSTIGKDVLTTIVDGKIVYENKQFINLDIKEILEKVNKTFNRDIE
ncbi:amidohydrolase [Candidatus Mycoplasma pogonae]